MNKKKALYLTALKTHKKITNIFDLWKNAINGFLKFTHTHTLVVQGKMLGMFNDPCYGSEKLFENGFCIQNIFFRKWWRCAKKRKEKRLFLDETPEQTLSFPYLSTCEMEKKGAKTFSMFGTELVRKSVIDGWKKKNL